MDDVIKSINISAIDILGMVLPGCAFILVMNEGHKLESMLSSYFAFESASAKLFLLLIAGYVVGMLFHTVSDLAERCLWECYLTDPKFYAAYKVSGRLKESIPNVEGVDHCGGWHVWRGVKFCVGFMLNIGVLGVAWSGFGVRNFWELVIPICFAILLFLFSFYIADQCSSSSKKSKYARYVSSVKACEDNAWIQTCISGGKSDSKRSLFDGFRVMMRNLLWCWAFLRLSGYSQSLTDALAMIPHGNLIYRFFLIAVVLRYMHNSYLKYKYSFEDYLYVSANR